MDRLETRMTQLGAADAAVFDPVFTHLVMARIAARRARLQALRNGVVVGGVSLALAAAAPFLARVTPLLVEAVHGMRNFTGLIALTLLMIAVGLAPGWWVMKRSL